MRSLSPQKAQGILWPDPSPLLKPESPLNQTQMIPTPFLSQDSSTHALVWFQYTQKGRRGKNWGWQYHYIHSVYCVFRVFYMLLLFILVSIFRTSICLSPSDSLFNTGLEVLVKYLAENPHPASIKAEFLTQDCLECPHLPHVPLIPSHIRKTHLSQFFDTTRNPIRTTTSRNAISRFN